MRTICAELHQHLAHLLALTSILEAGQRGEDLHLSLGTDASNKLQLVRICEEADMACESLFERLELIGSAES